MIWEKSFYFSQKPLKIIPIDVFRLWVASRDLKTHFLTIWYFIKVFNTNRKSEILENIEFQNFRIDFHENIKIALVDGFHRNRCQNEANTLYFSRKKLKFEISWLNDYFTRVWNSTRFSKISKNHENGEFGSIFKSRKNSFCKG